jgi:tetratricopeptide (TPR) repeat protein
MELSRLFMKRKRNPNGFHKRRAAGAVAPSASSSVLSAIRNAFQGGDYQGALSRINQQLGETTDPIFQSKLVSLTGDCLFKQGNFSDAASAYATASQLAQNQPAVWLRAVIGQVRSLLKDVQIDAAQAQALAAVQTAQTFYQQYQIQLVQAQATVAAGGQAVIPAAPPSIGHVASRLGKAFFEEGELDTAKNLFQAAVQSGSTHCHALLGLAEIALRENNPADAIAFARQALTANNFHAKSLSAWTILLAAGRKSGTDVLDSSLLNSLVQSPAPVRAHAVLLLAKTLRGQSDARWTQIANDWLQSAGPANPIITAELRKLKSAQNRITSAPLANRLQAAQNLLQTPNISPREWLSATKEVVRTSLLLGQGVDTGSLISQGVSKFGQNKQAEYTHGLALACQKAGRPDLAISLFQQNIATTTGAAWGKSVWALARLQAAQGDHASAAQSFWNYSQNSSVPQRFKLYALLEWVKELSSTNQPDLMIQAKPQIEAALPQITDYELVLDLARKVYFSHSGHSTWKDFALEIYQQGKNMALKAFVAAGNPSVAINILFKFCRRARSDFRDGDTVLSTWTQLSDVKKQWLWSASDDYWYYLELVFRSYREAKRYPDAEQFIAPLLNDPATPPNGYAILGASYAIMKRTQGDLVTMFSIYTQMTQTAPTHEVTSEAYYWFALQAWNQGSVAQTNVFIQKLLLALGKDCTLYWKRDLAASVLCLKAGLDISQIPPQTDISADELQKRLKVIQTDLALLNA